MTKDEAMLLALKAFELYQSKMSVEMFDAAIAALRQALEQPEQEPVAKVDMTKKGYIAWLLAGRELQQDQFLYTAPPKREWQGLTDEEIVKASIGNVEGEHMLPHSFAREIEKLLREKNHD